MHLFRTIIGLGLFLWLALSLFSPSLSVYAELPPRPEPEPTVIPGGQIKLIVTDPTGDEWTEIEWQDSTTGDWHLVDGWKGHLEADGSTGVRVWWVDESQLNSGAFRWLVYDQEGGELVATSENFDTPVTNKLVTIVTVTIDEAAD